MTVSKPETVEVTQAGLFPRIVTHDEAWQAAMNFIDAHFRNPKGKGVYTSIPARPDNDDIVLSDYIKQQRSLARLNATPSRQEADVELAAERFYSGVRAWYAGKDMSFQTPLHGAVLNGIRAALSDTPPPDKAAGQ